MSRGRPLDDAQRTPRVLLMVTDLSLWTRARAYAISHEQSLSSVVEEALARMIDPSPSENPL